MLKSILAVYAVTSFFFSFMREKNAPDQVKSQRRYPRPRPNPNPRHVYCKECKAFVPARGDLKFIGWFHERTCSSWRKMPGV